MAESRRVEFTTLTCDSPSSSSSSSSSSSTSSSFSDLQVQESPSSGSVLQADGTRPDRTTVRLVLSLFESDERRFPEFSFTQLTQNQLKHKDEGPLFTLEQKEKRETDEVAAIARKLEERYPNKKEDRIQDLIDIGFGYDDEDSFIDNSEPYDEFVPASITTKFGGFYVNSGVLLFRPASDTETIDLTTDETSKKRKLHGGQDKPKKKPCIEDGEMKSNVESSTLSEIGPDNEMKQRKKKKGVCTLSVTGMLKKFQREKEKERQKLVKQRPASGVTGLPTIPRCPADAAGGGGSGLADPLLSLIGSTNDHVLIQAASTVDFDIDLVSLLDSEETLSSGPQPATDTQLFTPTVNHHSQFTVPQTPKTHFQPKTHPEQIQLLSEAGSSQLCPPLPEGLPPALEDSVRTLMTVVKISEGESKLKFFTPEINSILLEIELQCRGQTGQLRSRLYTHLSSFLPCSRETLLKRVKKLLLTHMEPPDLDDPIQKLKEAIAKAMPEQIESYRTNCQAYEQVKTSKTTEDGTEVNQTVAPEDTVKRGGPKKLFKWNEEIRECLCHVLRPKMDRYEKEKNGNQEVEEFLKTLLDNEVKPLWPKGWMQTRPLIRESRELLGFFTSLPVKKTRPDKKQSSISGASTVLDVLQGAPPLKVELPQDPEVFPVASKSSNSIPLDVGKKEAAPLKSMEPKKGGGVTAVAGSSTPAEPGEPLVMAAPAAPALSLLELLADQALAREQPLAISQEILAAAIAKYRRSGQHWSYAVDTKRPPPPPQSSPVNFPVSRVCQVALPQPGDFTRNLDVQIIPDDSCILIQ